MPLPPESDSIPGSLSEPVNGNPGITSRSQLLVSVRDAAEADAAVEAGVGIVDWKEPNRGALAPTERELWDWASVRWEQLRQRFDSGDLLGVPPLSAALGERDQALVVASDLPGQFRFAKVGPSRCCDADQLRRLWSDIRDRLDDRIELVAVAYADWKEAGCLAPDAVFEWAAREGFTRCLLDTFCKDGRSSLQKLGGSALLAIAETARQRKLWWALAGSICQADVARLDQLGVVPDCFAVRGDVCRGARESSIDPSRIHDWLETLRGISIG